MKIYLLPGILGSQLGRAARRRASRPICCGSIRPTSCSGRLTELRWPRARAAMAARPALAPLQPLGAIVYSYLALKLRLAAAGFEVVLYDYDWRGDVLASGRALAARLAADDAERAGADRSQHGRAAGALGARAVWRRRRAHHAR